MFNKCTFLRIFVNTEMAIVIQGGEIAPLLFYTKNVRQSVMFNRVVVF